jgi:adenylate cyclase
MATPTAASLNKIKDIAIGKPSWGGVIGALIAALVGVSLLVFKFGLGLVHLSYDLPFAIRPTIMPDEVVLVYMDEDSHKNLEQPQNAPWDRSLHTRLLERLTREQARAVVFDIVFNSPGPDEAVDKQFAEAIKANGKVVLAADIVTSGYGRDGAGMRSVVLPHEPFYEAAAAIGSAEMVPEDDLFVRHHLVPDKDDLVPGLSWAAAQLYGAAVTQDEKNQRGERWFNYYGPPTTISNVSFYQVILTNFSDAIAAGSFSNKVVFVGARLTTKFSGDRKDEFPTPHSRWAKSHPFMPGVEIQATQFLNLIHGDWLHRTPRVIEVGGLAILGLTIGYSLARFRAWTVTCLGLGLLVLTFVAAYLSFAHLRLWFPWVIIVVQILVALAWSLVFNSVQLYVENKMYRATIALYLSPKLVRKFATDKAWLQPGAKKQTLTVLFSDIASFTSISEGMDSDELAKHMNSYFQTAVSKCIHHTDGTIVKYIGDAIFAFWNAPDPQDDHPLRACEAALRFRDQPPQYMNGQLLVTRIGLHTGVANVGNFGSTARVDYTALGENINLASRMEGLNKYLNTIVLLTGETHAGVAGRVVSRYIGSFRLKGFDRNVEVYELMDLPEKAEASRVLRDAFAKAVALFKQKQFGEAQAAFQRMLETAPNDGPSKFYLKHLEELRTHPVPADWEGEIELKEK